MSHVAVCTNILLSKLKASCKSPLLHSSIVHSYLIILQPTHSTASFASSSLSIERLSCVESLMGPLGYLWPDIPMRRLVLIKLLSLKGSVCVKKKQKTSVYQISCSINCYKFLL